MVEVPAAALAADLLGRDAAFFTIGTNDLIQYTLAVDRNDERVSDLYEPLHPAVIRLLRLVRRAATRLRIDASVCGEMASDPALIGLLIGLGLHRVQHDAGGDAGGPSGDRRARRQRRPPHRARSAADWRPPPKSSSTCSTPWPRPTSAPNRGADHAGVTGSLTQETTRDRDVEASGEAVGL